MSNENKDRVSWKTILVIGIMLSVVWFGSALINAIMNIGA